jgi:2-polyprenyl-3-methyl-5-hydroxy-6-metoxy-1,4-benzoquinol methylase
LPSTRDIPVLDLACGHGNCLYLLEQQGYSNLTGVDLGAEQLELAAKYAPTASLVQDDLMHFLSARPSQYGLIVCLNIIEHFSKQELFQFLDLLVDALLLSGRVIFETPNAESPWFGSVGYADLTHEWFFTPRSLEETLTLVGLEDFEARPSEPVPNGGKSWIRYLTWKAIKQALAVWNLAETGSVGSGIYTRVFVATATKRTR